MTGDINVVCRYCGGYGVVFSGRTLNNVQPCIDCGSRGYTVEEPWDAWQPNPIVLKRVVAAQAGRSS